MVKLAAYPQIPHPSGRYANVLSGSVRGFCLGRCCYLKLSENSHFELYYVF